MRREGFAIWFLSVITVKTHLRLLLTFQGVTFLRPSLCLAIYMRLLILPLPSSQLTACCFPVIVSSTKACSQVMPPFAHEANRLTQLGESVPVSKISATDESLSALDLAASSIPPVLARCFLFFGTKIIRARRPHDDVEDEAVGLAMVVRIGFNTTKGSLVRSMLFPKPSGFTFYRDSFRYISVMAGIAVLGFVVSFINFIHLKVCFRCRLAHLT